MVEFNLADKSSVSLGFRGSDLAISLAYNHSSGERVVASTFLYGAGKNTPGYATSLQNELMYTLAPLARNDDTSTITPVNSLSRNFAIEVGMPRPGDSLKITTSADGSINLHLRGQNMGFSEKATVNLSVVTDTKAPHYPLFQALQHFLQSPRI